MKQEVSIGVSDQPSGMTQSNESLASCQECITTWYQDMKTWCSRPPTYAHESPFLFPPGRLPASVRDRAQPRRRACFAGGIRHRQKLHAARSDDPLHVSHSLAGARSMRSKLERWNVPSKTENSFWLSYISICVPTATWTSPFPNDGKTRLNQPSAGAKWP